MSGFWESSEGEVTGNPKDAFASMFKRVPDGTMALAEILSFTNQEHNGSKFLAIEWKLVEGEFADCKVTQKIRAFEGDSKKRHRALNMMKLIYQQMNVKPKSGDAPNDEDLSVFVGKRAGIKINETEPNQDGKQYNWVSEVHPSSGFKSKTGTSLVVEHVNSSSVDSAFSRNKSTKKEDDLLDDIPF